MRTDWYYATMKYHSDKFKTNIKVKESKLEDCHWGEYKRVCQTSTDRPVEAFYLLKEERLRIRQIKRERDA